MFVAAGARALLLAKRQKRFYEQYVATMIREAEKLGMTTDQLIDMIRRGEGTR